MGALTDLPTRPPAAAGAYPPARPRRQEQGSRGQARHRQERKRQKRERQAGFSVLEAVVAVALVAAAFLPLLLLQSRVTETALAIERTEARVRSMEAALAYLATVNPSMRPSGQEQIGAATLAWTSTTLMPSAPVRGLTGQPSRYDATLFRVQASLRQPDGRRHDFEIDRLGWIARTPHSANPSQRSN